MQTNISAALRDTADGREAESVLRKCVHCGFCNATCPTYQILGDELDGPRGRIYLIKQLVEGEAPSATTRLHLDRCLTCRACETTCPSGVEYGRLAEVGRKLIEQQAPRPWYERLMRRALTAFLLSPGFGVALRIGRWLRPVLPSRLRQKIPIAQARSAWPARRHPRKMVLLAGCVQPALLPDLNAATARVLDALGIETLVAREARCCGALRLHLGQPEAALDDMRRSIDAWWPLVEQGVEALVMNASGCGVTVKEWGYLLRNDPRYSEKAQRISALTRDLAEVLANAGPALAQRLRTKPGVRVAFHPPCTLQHGQQIRGAVETVLRAIGVEPQLPADSHLCCGSAGTYSLLQPQLAGELRDRKLAALAQTQAEVIVSANVGCITHLQSEDGLPVKHWIELIDAAL